MEVNKIQQLCLGNNYEFLYSRWAFLVLIATYLVIDAFKREWTFR